jgi:hypothetical protein
MGTTILILSISLFTCPLSLGEMFLFILLLQDYYHSSVFAMLFPTSSVMLCNAYYCWNSQFFLICFIHRSQWLCGPRCWSWLLELWDQGFKLYASYGYMYTFFCVVLSSAIREALLAVGCPHFLHGIHGVLPNV